MSEHGWESNAGVADVVASLRAARRIALFTHLKPDGDAVGSTLALARALVRMGKVATPVYLEPWSARFDAIVGATDVIHERAGWEEDARVRDADLVLVCDTGSWGQIAGARAFVEARRDRVVIIDHHAHGDGEMAAMRLIDTVAAAACEIAAKVCCGLLGVEAVRMPVDVGEALYLGISTDTGWFRYSNTTRATMMLAADLIAAGVRANELYQAVEQSDTEGRVRLIGRAVEGMEILDDGAMALMTVRQKDLRECGASLDEAGGLTDLPQMIGSGRGVAVLIEQEDGTTKISLRSKAEAPGMTDVVDVNKAAQTLGGGGHKHAAGARLDVGVDAARGRVLAAIEGEM